MRFLSSASGRLALLANSRKCSSTKANLRTSVCALLLTCLVASCSPPADAPATPNADLEATVQARVQATLVSGPTVAPTSVPSTPAALTPTPQPTVTPAPLVSPTPHSLDDTVNQIKAYTVLVWNNDESGSGVSLGNGKIVTAANVVEGNGPTNVRFSDGR
jgi:hypothetical protein